MGDLLAFADLAAFATIAEPFLVREEAANSVLIGSIGNLRRHPEYISGDGFHPSTLGYAKLAELFYQTLKSAR